MEVTVVEPRNDHMTTHIDSVDRQSGWVVVDFVDGSHSLDDAINDKYRAGVVYQFSSLHREHYTVAQYECATRRHLTLVTNERLTQHFWCAEQASRARRRKQYEN